MLLTLKCPRSSKFHNQEMPGVLPHKGPSAGCPSCDGAKFHSCLGHPVEEQVLQEFAQSGKSLPQRGRKHEVELHKLQKAAAESCHSASWAWQKWYKQVLIGPS